MKVLVALFAMYGVVAFSQEKDQYNYPQIVDTSHTSEDAITFFDSYFTAKSSHHIAETMMHFSPDLVTYTDATFGWPLDGYKILEGVFSQYMPTWPKTGLSYPTRLIGGDGSAVVAFTDTPELFGDELRILGAVDLKDGKIVRWVDYWDGRSIKADLYKKLRTPEEKFPTDFKESAIESTASAKIRQVCRQLQSAFAAADALAASQLFSYDAVYEDMTLRTQLLGQAAIEQFLGRVLVKAPFGENSRLRHVVGNDLGGGFEWVGSPNTSVKCGITAIELDAQGKISRLTTVYDGRLLGDAEFQALVLLSVTGNETK